MPLTQTQLTPRALAARRANARKSTGPRTEAGKRRVALNALQGGGHLRRLAAGMRELGENPLEFRRLFADLLDSYQPATAAEALLVEDVATLRWQRRRCERAQAGVLAQHQDVSRQEAIRSAVKRRYRCWSHPAGAVGGGLRGAADAAYKFEQLKEMIDILEAKIEAGDFSDETRSLVRTIYGENPTGRGASIAKLFEDLARSGAQGMLFEATLQALKICLTEDSDVAELEEAACVSEGVGPSQVSQDAWLAPDRTDWRHLLRQQTTLDRQIERKTRLLLAMQRERQSQEERELDRAPAKIPPAPGNGGRPAETESELSDPAPSTEDSCVPAEAQTEHGSAAVKGAAPQKDCLFLPEQSCDVEQNKGQEAEMGVKTKLKLGRKTEPIGIESDG